MTTPRYPATAYRAVASKYLDHRAAMLYDQERARLNGERHRAERYQIGIDALQAAADKHFALADEAERMEETNGK